MANNRSHKLSHTMIRGRIYYTNFRQNDSTTPVRLTLGTDSRKQAEVIMNQIRPFIPLVQNGAMDLEEFKLKIQGFRAATKQDFDEYLLNWLKGGLEEAKRLPELGRYHKQITGEPLSPLDTANEAQGYANSHMGHMYNGNDISARMMTAALKKKMLTVNESDLDQIHHIASQIDMNQAFMSQAYEAFYSGDLIRYQQILDSMASALQKAAPTDKAVLQESFPQNKVALDETSPAIGPTLLEVWNEYIKDKGQKWRKQTANENQRFFDVLYHVVGDVPVDSVTKQHVRDSLKVAENLPTRTRLPYSRMSLAECIDYDVPEDDLIASEHVHKHLKLWRSLLKTYLVDQKDILTKSPTDGISHEVKSNRGGKYIDSELSRIKKYLFALPDSDYRKWYFLTLVYTGARRSEIAEIRKQHIRKDEETGRWYIFIEGGKTEHARRQVPIHKTIEAELRACVETLKDSDRVFGNLPNYTTITYDWVELLRVLEIPDYNEFGLKRRVHSLRHTFISHAIASVGNHALVQFVVGHSRTQSLGITARYTHTPPLKALLPVIDWASRQ
ncbi:recombinase XerC [Pectobacterium actinidiae]|uniref:Recombinase XerC n=2 Tax=Pectobacterium actinidiae TaxID=1507808 RepID=A0A1V2R2T5_9GAMM|nr:site-specific recombinase, phage integrase family [Pectobacterium actinidiae]ONK03611.1 recombinase XerC [Pectobacterium actinidiae]ONK05340.1 recombinase XerC [Pectobacterium actinidiae]